MMRSDAEIFAIIAPLAFRIAEKFFKFASWAFIIVLIHIARSKTNSLSLHVLEYIATFAFTIPLLLYAIWIPMRDPSNFGIPKEWYMCSRLVQIIIGFALVLIIGSPYFFLDQIMNALANARLN
jgi:hypothetical protein